MQRRGLVVAVDGPSGSGKSSVSRAVARATGMRYLDTGAMYRAATWAALRDGVDPGDVHALLATLDRADITVGTDPDATGVLAYQTDVSRDIRGPAVTAAVSAVSAVSGLRDRLVRRQRELIGAGDIVVEGRDIASVVVPDAQVKVYLDADVATRAGRRGAQDGPAGARDAEVAADLARRDRLDSTRAASPLVRSDGATVIDSTALGFDAVVRRVLELVDQARVESRGSV